MTGFLAAPRPLIIFLVVLFVAGCAQTGDLGRSRQTSSFGLNVAAATSEDAVRTLSYTDEEIGMRNRIEAFVSFEGSRSRGGAMMQGLRAQSGKPPVPEDYYAWLRGQKAATPAGLYGKILNDLQIDLLGLPAVFAAICAVNEIDRRRSIAITGVSSSDLEIKAAQADRRLENSQMISRFVASLAFRHDSYAWALEQLLVDAPYRQARRIDVKIAELAAQLETARASQYCIS